MKKEKVVSKRIAKKLSKVSKMVDELTKGIPEPEDILVNPRIGPDTALLRLLMHSEKLSLEESRRLFKELKRRLKKLRKLAGVGERERI